MGRLIVIGGLRGCIDMGITLQSMVVKAIANHRKRNRRNDLFNQMETKLDELRIGPIIHKEDDETFKRGFMSKKTWSLIQEVSPQQPWYHGIWFKHSTPKYYILALLTIRNRLAKGDRMVSWNRDANTVCSLFHDPMETQDHIFFRCRYTSLVWRSLCGGLLAERFTSDWSEIIPIITVSSSDAVKIF
ncbi:uncharacterized protein LOC112088831 [Eutrema salsugineum]|uniref:uncharacterized protein LOC112088831 n=1 Tax=Eutrema salsugineum TaxID=72664 RepID=UPI000CED0806|nr:uncharacterized protein LOC112088831 [Eutrema salsugineum]